MKVAVFDYGSGNLFNIILALQNQGLDVAIVNEIEQSFDFDGLVLPGVGNFAQATKLVAKYRGQIIEFAERKLILGICLGMQLFFESSEEGSAEGLGLINGKVVRLPNSLKVPHMGWNRLIVKKPTGILEGIADGSWCYFMHSYYASTRVPVVAAQTEYSVTFPSVIESKGLIGTQFHPEKSGETGRLLLQNFARMLRS